MCEALTLILLMHVIILAGDWSKYTVWPKLLF